MNYPPPMGIHPRHSYVRHPRRLVIAEMNSALYGFILMRTYDYERFNDFQTDYAGKLNLENSTIDNDLQKVSCLPNKVIAEMNIPRPMGVHSLARNNCNELKKGLFPTGIFPKIANLWVLSSRSSEAVPMFWKKEKKKIRVHAFEQHHMSVQKAFHCFPFVNDVSSAKKRAEWNVKGPSSASILGKWLRASSMLFCFEMKRRITRVQKGAYSAIPKRCEECESVKGSLIGAVSCEREREKWLLRSQDLKWKKWLLKKLRRKI